MTVLPSARVGTENAQAARATAAVKALERGLVIPARLAGLLTRWH